MKYFDYSATTPPFPEVANAVKDAMLQLYGNPSSLHKLGVQAERLLEQARDAIAGQLKLPEGYRVIFTSGGTESNNLAIKGAAFAAMEAGRGKHVITTAVEHASVLESFTQLKERFGFELTVLPVDHHGRVSPVEVAAALQKDTVLVSVMHVNNEVGAIQPIDEIGKIVKAAGRALFHVDAVQSVAAGGLSLSGGCIDMLSMSAHKCKGPKGIGLLAMKEHVQLLPLLSGGGQEFGLRSGTEQPAAAAGFAKALRLSAERTEREPDLLMRYHGLVTECIRKLPNLILNGGEAGEAFSPHIINFSFPGMKSEVIVHALEEEGIAVSTRSACSSGEDKASHVLAAMGVGEARAKSSIRISVSHDHTMEDMEHLCRALENVSRRFS
nr:cysteine desulfurase family protein [Paenibacillus turpanensis]